MKEITMATNFEPHECVIFVQSTKIDTHETKAIHSSQHPVSGLHIYTFVVSRAFIADAASQAGDADSSRAPGLTSGLHGSVNVHRDVRALSLVPQ